MKPKMKTEKKADPLRTKEQVQLPSRKGETGECNGRSGDYLNTLLCPYDSEQGESNTTSRKSHILIINRQKAAQ